MFRPDDPNNLLQVPPQFHVTGSGVERIKGYRFPAPGSQPLATVPTRKESDLYQNLNYTVDPRNLPSKVVFQFELCQFV